MKFLEKMFQSKQIVMYNVSDFSNVTDELVAAVNWPKGVETLSFSFEPFSPAGGYVKHKLRGAYVIRYIYGGKTSTLRLLGKELKSSPIEARAPKNVKEALAVTKATLCENSAAERRRKGPAYQKELRRYLATISGRKTKSVLLFKNGRSVGIASMLDSIRLDGKKCSTFTWFWIDKRLPKAEYEDARYKATKWVKENAQEYLASANFDYNKEAQRWDSRFGLKPYRVFFAHKGK